MFRLRLKDLREKNGLSQSSFAKSFGVAQSTVGMWEAGKREPNLETINLIAKYFNVSVDYLLGRDSSSSLSIESFNNIFSLDIKKYPLLGEIACGKPIFTNEDRESYILSGTEIKADFCLRCVGDSMIGARIFDGDIVFIREQPIVENGEVAAVVIGDEATLKRWYYYPEQQKLVLNAENSKYEPLIYIGNELENVHCLGKAVAFQSDVI